MLRRWLLPLPPRPRRIGRRVRPGTGVLRDERNGFGRCDCWRRRVKPARRPRSRRALPQLRRLPAKARGAAPAALAATRQAKSPAYAPIGRSAAGNPRRRGRRARRRIAGAGLGGAPAARRSAGRRYRAPSQASLNLVMARCSLVPALDALVPVRAAISAG